MAEEQKSTEIKKRRTATEAASKVAAMTKASIMDVLKAKEEGRKIAYTFINCSYEEIIRAMDVVPAWT